MVLTNADGAIDYKIMWSDAAEPGRAGWRPWIAHEPGRYITGMAVLRDHLVRGERVDANDRIVVTERESLAEHAIAFDEEAYALSFSTGYEWEAGSITFVYQSPTTPRSWFDYDLAARTRTLRKVQEVPSGHDPARYEASRAGCRRKPLTARAFPSLC